MILKKSKFLKAGYEVSIVKKVKKNQKKIFSSAIVSIIFILILGAVNSSTHSQQQKTLDGTTGSLETVSGTYVGDLIDDKFQGNGKFIFNTGDSYQGEWKSGTYSGTGTFEYVGIGNYSGEYISGVRSGEGTFSWSTGDAYSGSWEADKMCGEGTITYSNGTQLIGSFSENAIITGQLKYSDANGYYSFEVKDGQLTNQIEITFSSGEKYRGTFSKDTLTGSGTITYSCGDKYEGNLVDGKKVGTGTYTWASGASYIGDWSSDKMNGSGTYYYTSSTTGQRLCGTFVNNYPSGKCTYYADSSTKYTTTWLDGKCINVSAN